MRKRVEGRGMEREVGGLVEVRVDQGDPTFEEDARQLGTELAFHFMGAPWRHT